MPDDLRELPRPIVGFFGLIADWVGLSLIRALALARPGWSVGMIPFRVNELTVRANPLKLREYLAAGLPVVSTPLPEVARYDGLVRLADGLEGLIRGIEAAPAERSEGMVRCRVEAMRGEGWELRVVEMCALIAARLGVAA